MAGNTVKISNIYPVPTPGATDTNYTISSSAVDYSDMSMTVNSLTRYIVFDVTGADVRVTFDGSAPTSSNGHLVYAGQSYTWALTTFKLAKFIRAASTDAVIHATQFTD